MIPHFVTAPFFVIPTVLKDTSGKDLNHEARKEVTKLAKGVRESP